MDTRAEVTQMKNDKYRVLWKCNLTLNDSGELTFKCPGRKPTFLLTFTYRPEKDWKSKLSLSLKIVEPDFFDQDYPEVVTAFLDGIPRDMKKASRGQWDEVKWTYHPCREYQSYSGLNRKRSARLTLVLELPRTGDTYLASQFVKLVESGTMADVQFTVIDQEMKAHAAILSAASPVMAAMFEPGRFLEGQSRKVEIVDIEPEVFKQLLRYVYTGTAPKLGHKTITQSLFLAADKYQMDKLKQECEQRLMLQLKLENVVEYLIMSHQHSAPKLKEATIQFVVTNRKELWNRPGMKQLGESYPELFFLISHRIVMNTM